ncbi:hypothetical protein DSECCO2_534670 [anaerobic digester metagenome]
MCVAFIACFEFMPSPKSQSQEAEDPPVPLAVNNTTRGAVPEVTLAVKSKTGNTGLYTAVSGR